MGRAALAEVELDRVGIPVAVGVADHDEVDREAPEHALGGELGADLGRLLGDRAGVGEVGREAAAEVALSARPAEELVVGREQLDLAQRGHAQLHARAADLDPAHALLDDAAVLAQAAEVALEAHLGVLEGHRRGTLVQRSALLGRSRRREPAQLDVALPRPETPSLSLTMASPAPGRAARRRVSASTTSSRSCTSSKPCGCDTPVCANNRRQPVFVPSGSSRGSAPYSGTPSASARSRSSVVVVYGIRWQRVRSGMRARDLGQDARPLEQLVGQRARRAVVGGDQVQARAGVARDDAGQQGEVVLDDALGRSAAPSRR